jgi:hypothetical protein
VSLARAVGLLAGVASGRARLIRALGIAARAFAVVLVLPIAVAVAHKGNPDFRSELRGLTPSIPGVQVQVLNYDDRLLLINRSGADVVVQGYDGEPYVRLLADGTVQENRLSPSLYLNEDRFAQVKVPPRADPKAAPRWQTDNKAGRFEWHDHRIHYMAKGVPPKVEDNDDKTKIFDWRVPISVGGKRAAVTGALYWQPDSSTAPVGAFVALGVLCALVIALVLAVRVRRRRRVVQKTPQAW